MTHQKERSHCIRKARAVGGKLGGNSCISEISAGVLRDALGGKAGGNSYGTTYDFHDVTIVFTEGEMIKT